MRKLTHITKGFLLIFAFACTLNLVAQTEEGTIKVQTNESIKRLIAKKRAANKKRTQIMGYKIQLFFGSEQNAIAIRKKFSEVFPDIPTERLLHSPYWKVWVGSYKTKLEADRALAEVKEGFPGAIRINTKVRE